MSVNVIGPVSCIAIGGVSPIYHLVLLLVLDLEVRVIDTVSDNFFSVTVSLSHTIIGSNIINDWLQYLYDYDM